MRKKLVAVLGSLGVVMALAAVGCSSSSDSVTGGGGTDEDSGSGASKDGGGGFGGDSGNTSKDGGNSEKDGGIVVEKDSGVVNDGGIVLTDSGIAVVDSGTVISHTDAGTGTTLDAGSTDAGATLPDGGPLACFTSGDARFDNSTGLAIHQNKCTSTQINAFDTDCFGSGATTAACNAILSADPDCGTCIFGGAAKTNPSAVVLPIGAQDEVNSLGCLAAISTATAQCKFDYENVAFCSQTACQSCSDSASSACQNFAQTDATSVCAINFGIDTTCANTVGAVGTLAAQNECGIGVANFDTAFKAVATTFCGL